ncbi:MAG TPA: 50S ribosomal protein L23 [Bacteroidales bacterium]|nr:50S ribosomal protein L23 [Bacteroidales bacterium]
MDDVIIKPLITEKMTGVTEKYNNKYGFLVRKEANKLDIKKAIESFYDVKVTSINTMIYQGKRKSRYTKQGFVMGRTNSYKRVIVTLAEGQTIDFYSSI